jgi:hypothetical protein
MDTVATAGTPNELEATLAGNARARERFEKLPPSHQREYIEWIGEAKKQRLGSGELGERSRCCLTGAANRTTGPVARGVDSEAR